MASAFEADSAAWGLQKKEVKSFSYGLVFKKKCVLLIAHLLIYRWQTDSVVSLDDCLAVGKLVVSRDG